MATPSPAAGTLPATSVLRPASMAAARERARLEAGRGRSRVTGRAVRLGLAVRYLGSEQAAISGLRYRPVAWSVIALVCMAFLIPGRMGKVLPAQDVALPPLAPAPPASAPPAPAPVTLPPVRLPDLGGVPVDLGPGIPLVPPSVPPAPVPPAADDELVVRGFGWYGSLSATGLGAVGVPDGSLPVAGRLGDVDKVGVVRLSGNGTTLHLRQLVDGTREALGRALIQACAVVDADWKEAPDQPAADAPEWDADRCVLGKRSGETWSFDLSGFADPAAEGGFALVPAPGAPTDFQVALDPS